MKHIAAAHYGGAECRIARPHGRARIETSRPPVPGTRPASIARPHGRARIETSAQHPERCQWCVSPGLTAGRGLKRRPCLSARRHSGVSPGLTAGRGLKQTIWRPSYRHPSIARPHGRARIETSRDMEITAARMVSPGLTAGRGLKHVGYPAKSCGAEGIARPHGRARIETAGTAASSSGTRVSPGLTAGRGLKRHDRGEEGRGSRVSPGLTAGRGLKLPTSRRDPC